MKFLGSSMFIIEAIVLGLAIPVAITSGYDHKSVYLTGAGLIVMCILAAGAMRRDRSTAVRVGVFVQIIISFKGLVISPFLIPGIIFWFVLVYAIYASGKVDRVKSVK